MLIGCAGTEDPGTTDPKCNINTPSEKSPGYPYNLTRFKTEVVPILVATCTGSACHSQPTGQGSYTVWTDAATSACNLNQTFNSTIAKVDLLAVANSPLISVVSGGSNTHPRRLDSAAADKANLDKLTAFITEAKTTKDADGGGQVPTNPDNSVFSYAVYQSQIQPALNAATCAVAGCHLTGANGFFLKADPAPNSADMEFNFKAVTTRTKFDPPSGSTIYVRATTPHAGGSSRQVATAAADLMLAWITAAKDANGGGGGGQPGCAPADAFNLGVFQSEVLRIISGEVDLNVPGGQGSGAGCQSSACHGDTTRGPGTLIMSKSDLPAKVLANFACFVNLESPSESEILKCPLNQVGCRKFPDHPGQNIFRDGADKNYQRFLAFIYGAKAAKSPHDFAFYARKIDPFFTDPAIVLNDGQGLTCASFQGCHGVSGGGQSAPGGSDFPIIPNADEITLPINFVAATGFVNFLDFQNSSLFLYPTDEISKVASAHPGGPILPVNSQQALDILTWAKGLRPDGQGFARNWVVLGDFATNQINDRPVNEATLLPKLFQRDGGQFNQGKWEGEFSDSQVIDLTKQLRNNPNRTGYAATYLLNTDPFQRTIQLVVNSPNAGALFVDGTLRTQNNVGGQTLTTQFQLGAAGSKTPLSTAKIMVKLFQSANEQQFQFTAQLQDELGNILTDQNSGLVFVLSPDGGI
jgi:hypothetical protein